MSSCASRSSCSGRHTIWLPRPTEPPSKLGRKTLSWPATRRSRRSWRSWIPAPPGARWKAPSTCSGPVSWIASPRRTPRRPARSWSPRRRTTWRIRSQAWETCPWRPSSRGATPSSPRPRSSAPRTSPRPRPWAAATTCRAGSAPSIWPPAKRSRSRPTSTPSCARWRSSPPRPTTSFRCPGTRTLRSSSGKSPRRSTPSSRQTCVPAGGCSALATMSIAICEPATARSTRPPPRS